MIQVVLIVMGSVLTAQAQDWSPTWWGLQGLPSTAPEVPHFEVEQVVPQMHRWYAPRHLPESYVRPWYQGDTNYAREDYHRYVEEVLEGEVWYDTFGHHLGKGWLVYTWEQEQARRNGSLIRKGGRAYGGFFQNLAIASDASGGASARLMVGDAIFTTFTPLTFNKAGFNGLRLDYAGERYAGSVLLSRPSQPNNAQRTNMTHLVGGHAEVQTGDFARMGFTYINAHNAQSQVKITYGNPLHGTLTTGQNQPLKKLWVRLRDDSPEDGQHGAALFRYEIVFQDTSGREFRGREIGLLPRIVGGRTQAGALVADGSETILLEYDLASLDHEGIRSADLRQARVELAVADDYQVEMASDLQTDGEVREPETVFFTVRRASGNVQDNSNSRMLRLDYGLPTGNELLGMNWDLAEWKGLSVQGEAVLNLRHSMYPSQNIKHLHHFVDGARAAYTTAAYHYYPWTLFGEFFSIGDGYSTRYWLAQGNGDLRYKAPIPDLYEFVDDDDDHNGAPEWERPFQGSQRVAWPGYDENRDFLYDYNQNRNLFPDYEEPFLRFRSDRPEFLFGLDMNYNGTVDRLENDELPDYPYKKDHQGLNAYLRGNLNPQVSAVLGTQRVRLISGDGQTRSVYVLGSGIWNPGRDKLRVYGFGARVRDDIPDDLELWVQPVGGIGRMQRAPDRRPGRDAWRHTLYADWEQRIGKGLHLLHRGKWEGWWQRDSREDLRRREDRKGSGFLGVIDKAEWSLPLGLGVLEPRWKSEFRQDRPFNSRQPQTTSLEEILFLLWTQPLMAEQTSVNYYARYGRQLFNTQLQLGLEWGRFWMLEGVRQEIDQDFTSWTLVTQLTNRVGYIGYQVVTRLGVQWMWRDFARRESQQASLWFVTMNAGLR